MASEERLSARAKTGTLDNDTIQEFKLTVRGEVIGPGDDAYDAARSVWSGLIDRRPELIVRCTGVADVIEAVRLARERGLPIAVRGGGHGVAGHAVCDDCIVVDLSNMNGVHVDPGSRVARVGAGARWRDVDRETQVFGLAAPGGIVSDTGVAGLTLGGGFGWLRRKHGLSCDNLVAADVVTADGRFLTASAEQNADLFWALRGGGGNFGVVTSFLFGLHPIGQVVYLAAPLFPADRAVDVMRWFREWAANAPDEMNAITVLWSIAPAPAIPAEFHNRAVVIPAVVYIGKPEDGERLLAPVHKLGTPLLDLSGPVRFTALQTFFDEDYPQGRLYYWKSRYLTGLGDDAIEVLLEGGRTRPSPLSSIDIWQLGGAIGRVPAGETAYEMRDAPYMIGIEGNWERPEDTERNIAWTRRVFADLEPYSTGGVYVNFPGFGEEGEPLIRSTFGPNYDRLAAIKRKYDPGNLFRFNQNIRPANP